MAQPSHREQLVKGAVTCLQRKGYARTTARDIAAASQANLASIGYHFGSKEALLNEALIRIFERRNRYLGDITDAAGDSSPLGRLTALFKGVSDMFDAHRPLLAAFVEAVAQAERSEELRAQLAAHYRQARQGIAATVRDQFGGTEADVMASFLMALFDGLVIQWLLDAESTPSGEQLMTALVDTMTATLERSRV
jgi:AcrR family transcriptional regulator